MLSKFFKLSIYCSILYACYLLLLLSIPYLKLKPNIEFLLTKQFVYHIDIWRWAFYLHVFSSIFIIFFGLFQFNKFFIIRLPKTHKIFGYIYVILLLFISGPGALVMSFYANGGVLAQISFVILSFLWIIFTIISVFKIYKKDFINHGKWMLRSYALTLSAVSLRFFLYLFDYFKFNIGPIESYIIVAYSSWIINLGISEILIKKKFIENLFQQS